MIDIYNNVLIVDLDTYHVSMLFNLRMKPKDDIYDYDICDNIIVISYTDKNIAIRDMKGRLIKTFFSREVVDVLFVDRNTIFISTNTECIVWNFVNESKFFIDECPRGDKSYRISSNIVMIKDNLDIHLVVLDKREFITHRNCIPLGIFKKISEDEFIVFNNRELIRYKICGTSLIKNKENINLATINLSFIREVLLIKTDLLFLYQQSSSELQLILLKDMQRLKILKKNKCSYQSNTPLIYDSASDNLIYYTYHLTIKSLTTYKSKKKISLYTPQELILRQKSIKMLIIPFISSKIKSLIIKFIIS
mgnify:CR=1 FL=1